MRKLNDINMFIESQVDYYENNTDYSDQYIDFIGDETQLNNYDEDDIYAILESNLTTSTDYSIWDDGAVGVFPVGEIEIQIDTNLTQKEYNAIEDKIDVVSKFNAVDGVITAYICAGMNVRVYSDYKGGNND